jgi:hypothetical protein
MADLNELDEFNDPAVEVLHDFAVDLNCLVVTNHRFTLDAITRAEDNEIGNLQDTLAQQGPQKSHRRSFTANNVNSMLCERLRIIWR